MTDELQKRLQVGICEENVTTRYDVVSRLNHQAWRPMTRRHVVTFLGVMALSVAFGSTGCSSASSEAQSATARVVTDFLGRKVEIPMTVEHVAALDSFASETMVMIGAGEQMCGTPAGVQTDELLLELYPGLTDVAVPMSGGSINIETLLESDPDVVLLKLSLYYTEGEVDKLDKLAIPYLVVGYQTMAEQITAIEMVGDVCGGDAADSAAALAAYYQDTVDLVKEHAAKIPEKEQVSIYHAINELVLTDGSTSLGTDWVQCVGAKNVSADETIEEGETDFIASLEQIFVWDPDIIICNSAETMEYVFDSPKLEGLRAVYEEQVFNIPVGATRWGQRGSVETYLAMLWLGVTVYPDYYSDIDLKSTVVSYYQDYLGLAIDDETYEMMLSGEGLRSAAAGEGSGSGSGN